MCHPPSLSDFQLLSFLSHLRQGFLESLVQKPPVKPILIFLLLLAVGGPPVGLSRLHPPPPRKTRPVPFDDLYLCPGDQWIDESLLQLLAEVSLSFFLQNQHLL